MNKIIQIHRSTYIYIHTHYIYLYIYIYGIPLSVDMLSSVYFVLWSLDPMGTMGTVPGTGSFRDLASARGKNGLFRHAARLIKTLGKWQNISTKKVPVSSCFCNIGQWFSYLRLFPIMMWSKQNGTMGHYLIAFSQQKCGPIGPTGIDPGPVHVGMPWRSVHRSLAMDWLVAGSDRLGLDQTKFRSHFDQI